jgi:hypothetical protein
VSQSDKCKSVRGKRRVEALCDGGPARFCWAYWSGFAGRPSKYVRETHSFRGAVKAAFAGTPGNMQLDNLPRKEIPSDMQLGIPTRVNLGHSVRICWEISHHYRTIYFTSFETIPNSAWIRAIGFERRDRGDHTQIGIVTCIMRI